jgi:NadR type nicotinamide-nucleotide adenylyltransferase
VTATPAPLVRVCVTGPECTGKTSLARRLAEWVDTTWVPEASRLYAERCGAALTAADVGPIAREHITLADAAAEQARALGAGLIVLDTDLLSTVVYARHYYGTAPRWVERAERARRADLYLLCDVDIPWLPDGIRDRPERREAMFDLFRRALVRRRATWVEIRGDRAARWDLARRAVEQIQARRT